MKDINEDHIPALKQPYDGNDDDHCNQNLYDDKEGDDVVVDYLNNDHDDENITDNDIKEND